MYTLRNRVVVRSCSFSTTATEPYRILEGSKISTLHELGVTAGKLYSDRLSLGTKCAETKEWLWTTFAQRAEKAKRCTAMLRSMGVKRGDRVAVISKNRVEWATAAYGTYGAGAAFVPMYEQQQPQDWEYILRDSQASILFVARKDQLEIAAKAAEASAKSLGIICFEENESFMRLETALDQVVIPQDVYDDIPHAEDLATLIYTSGTTGEPKGVELTHKNLLWNALIIRQESLANMDRIPEPPREIRTLSILPWAHIFGQSCELHSMTANGAAVALAGDATTFLTDCKETKPTVLLAVPALYNRILDNFGKAKSHMPAWKQRLADRALALGDKMARSKFNVYSEKDALQNPPLNFWEKVQYKILDKLILSKVRDALGGDIKCLGSGGAAIPPQTRQFLQAIGLEFANGYGLTETSPVLSYEHCLDPQNRLPGSIGRALPGVKIRIAVDCDDSNDDFTHVAVRTINEAAPGEPGEIVVSSPGLMRGYWNKPQATNKVIFLDEQGERWFKTGDRGICEAIQGAGLHIRLVGRIKEQYKLSNGKYVVPTPIEEAFARSRFISQVFLYGDNRPYNVALVSPEWEAIEDELCNYKHVDDCPDLKIKQHLPFNFGPSEAIEALIANRGNAIKDLIEKELKLYANCKSYEFPKKWTILTQGFNVARNMLTPKLSLRRNIVLTEHQPIIDALYDAEEDDHLVGLAMTTSSKSSSSAEQERPHHRGTVPSSTNPESTKASIKL
uniref:AMP-dependent synthetase/ligase domain-containing protein n=1 Tax=Aureoumbra lagunensis TaxID=44058 RepID=A0A7S3JNS9_9STRA|mmetsp:Transcript_21376/g.27672  ORF Transcript_21376/g.27672 Transcript_21376/m.27672 type:complete len:735 (+) Transcript_21376:61-2265(+)